jgi:putative nucleotidyltransferase with HDIG domain
LRSRLRHEMDTEQVKVSEVLSALSFVLDIVEGQPEGHIIRSCYLGLTIGERLGLTVEQRSALFYALLLKDSGCSSNASRMSALFDADDFEVKRAVKTVNWTSLPHAALYATRTVSPEGSSWAKAKRLFNFAVRGQETSRRLIQIRCERGAEITRLMGLPEETAQAIRNLDEHWDGSGHPDGLKREKIPLLARICGLAQTVEVFYTSFGPTRAEEVAKTRRKKWFDPEIVDVFLAAAHTSEMWKSLARSDLAYEISRLEPPDLILTATPEHLDRIALAFAQIIDAKSPFTFRHSEGVAETAAAMSEYVGFDSTAVRDQRRAALLHDIGKLGISNRILDKDGPLTDREIAEVRKHPKLTYDVLSRVTPFKGIAEAAANHHAKLDGSGYHRGVTGESLDLPSRILAVADIYNALSRARPYRPAMPKEKALDILTKESSSKLCPQSVQVLNEMVSKDVIR